MRRPPTSFGLAFAALTLALGVLAVPAAASGSDVDNDGIGNRRDLCPSVAGRRADGCPTATWILNDRDGTPLDDWNFPFGSLGWRPVAGNWGSGDSVGAFDPTTGTWHLRDSPCHCSAVAHIHWDVDVPGPHQPIVGDWDGDGLDGLGIYTPATGTFHLRNARSNGPADLTFAFGGSQPARFVRAVAGDWDGDGLDTVGLFRPDTDRWRITDTNAAGPAGLFRQGRPGSSEQPITGDWDGDGDDGVGLLEEGGIWYLRFGTGTGLPNIVFPFGASPMRAVGGDWDLDGDDTIGVQRH